MPSVAAPLQTIAGTAPETASAPPTVPRPAIALTTTGACNEVAFYARSADDTTAITINFDATRRSPSIETVVQFRLPDPRISVFVSHGTGLNRGLCTDVVSGSDCSQTSQERVSAGSGTITLDPARSGPGHCGVHGSWHLDGVTDIDGATFAPININSNLIGCVIS